jgi:hypothetical protein
VGQQGDPQYSRPVVDISERISACLQERAEREALERALAAARDTKRKRCANVFRVLLKMAADTVRWITYTRRC